MKKVGVVFGGRSVEHEVSVITGMQIIENMDKSKYTPVAIYITKEGKWLTGPGLLDFKNFKNNNFTDTKEIVMSQKYGDRNLYLHPDSAGMFAKKIVDSVDVIFPAMHGTNGEDGAIQGLFELIGLPYVGCNVLASSVGMDKILMKDVYKSKGLPIVDYTWFYRTSWENDREAVLEQIEGALKYPMFVKPANLGSSIGITKAKDRESLIESIEVAVSYDRKVIIEKAVENPREINCAVMGYDAEVITSLCEEPLGWTEILSFEDKYIKSNSKSGKSAGDRRIIPAEIDNGLRVEIEELAKDAFTSIDAAGVSRIDFLVSKDNTVYINEINTLPGSISFYLWQDMDYPIKKLIDRLIEIAEITNKEKNKNMYSYDADLFNKIQYGSKV